MPVGGAPVADLIRPETAGSPRRIVVHDYAGHPFTMQLSRWLARRRHVVLHAYSEDVEAPHGRLERLADDPPELTIEGLSIGQPLPKYRLVRRWFQELDYGTRLGQRAVAFGPDVVLSTNAPPAVQSRLLAATRRAGVPLLCWVQDIFSLGAAEILKSRPWPLRRTAVRFLERVEFDTLRNAAGLIVISDDFLPLLAGKGVRHPRSAVIENWAPCDDLAVGPKDNPWSRAHGLTGRFVFLYAGTIGLKHNPAHLVNLARAFRDDPEVRVVVVSQGLGRRRLEVAKVAENLGNLILMDYQPFERLAEVLSTADVSLLLLEDYAGALSVPSKVYSYFCAGRPILAAIPAANLACRIIERENAGLCLGADDEAGFVAAARRLRADPALRAALVANQRAYAVRAFDIDRIGSRFLAQIDGVHTTAGGRT